ncbi:MAG: TolC family protein [Cytophagales bacterium]|nr:TolC family protein [Cytophagales bacterium]
MQGCLKSKVNRIEPNVPVAGFLHAGSGLSVAVLMMVFVFVRPAIAFGQVYSLNEVIAYAQNHSPEALKVKTTKENKYWQWRSYKSNYKPQLVLSSTLPDYRNRNIAVIQDDGSIEYRNVNQSQANIELSLEQNISLTGGKLFLNTGLARIDNINKNIHSYSGTPFFIGISQPVFAYNRLKWMNRIEPLKYDESLKEYIENMERIAYGAAFRFFNLLIAQISYEIAEKNLNNADTIYTIGNEKHAMGKISKNELLQLKFGLISAQKSVSGALLSQETSLLELSSYTGLQKTGTYSLSLPDHISIYEIDKAIAVEKALENSQRSVAFKRTVLEAKRNVEQAKRDNRLNAEVNLSYGTTNVAAHMPEIYQNAQTLQTLNFNVSMPILDWGRAKSLYKTAEANLKLVEYTVQQEKINFNQEIITQIEYFRMLKGLIKYTREADQIADQRYEIARLRYINGNISLTDYNIALEEKDRAKLDYIRALRDYWLTNYSIRILTLYDFKNDRQIIMDN